MINIVMFIMDSYKQKSLQLKRRFPLTVLSSLKVLGGNIRLARIERKMTVADFAERMRVSENTVLNIENGKPGVAIGHVANALAILQSIDQLTDILDMSSNDPIGDMMRRQRAPKRVHRRHQSKSPSTHDQADEEGLAL